MKPKTIREALEMMKQESLPAYEFHRLMAYVLEQMCLSQGVDLDHEDRTA